jgi:hypothetical protein
LIAPAIRQQQLLTLYNLFRGDPEIDQRALKHLIISEMIPSASGRLIMPETKELESEEENALMVAGALIVPLPNEDHRAHIRDHMAFLQDNRAEMDEDTVKMVMNHVKAHTDMMTSVYRPLSSNVATQPGMQPTLGALGGRPSQGGPPGVDGAATDGGQGSGAAFNSADLTSAVEGGNASI